MQTIVRGKQKEIERGRERDPCIILILCHKLYSKKCAHVWKKQVLYKYFQHNVHTCNNAAQKLRWRLMSSLCEVRVQSLTEISIWSRRATHFSIMSSIQTKWCNKHISAMRILCASSRRRSASYSVLLMSLMNVVQWGTQPYQNHTRHAYIIAMQRSALSISFAENEIFSCYVTWAVRWSTSSLSSSSVYGFNRKKTNIKIFSTHATGVRA